MLLSRATGTLPVSPHNQELQYLNYKLKIIFTGVVLNITCNPLTLHQPHHTTSCSRPPAHVRHMADTGKGECVRVCVCVCECVRPSGVGVRGHVTDQVCVKACD